MIKIKMPDWKIKWLLWGLVFMSIGLIITLLFISYWVVIPTLIGDQKQLTGHINKIEASSTDMDKLVKDIVRHMYLIPDANALKELEEQLKPLNGFKPAVRDFRELSDKKHSLEASIKNQISILNSASTKLLKHTETFSGMISIDIRKHISSNEQPGNLSGEDLLKELTRRQKFSNNLRLAVTLLINYGRQMLTTEDQQQVAGIKAEITQPVKDIEIALENLKNANMDSTELTGLVQNIETGYNLLKSALVEGDNSIAALRGQWLAEQDKIGEKSKELTNVTITLITKLEASQKSLKELRKSIIKDAGIVKYKVTAYIFFIICLVTTFIMVPITWLIRRRIVVPIYKLVSFADSLSQGDLTVEIKKGHNDEVGYLISKLGDMASNLNALIGQVQRSGIQVTSSATELSATSKQQEAVMKTQLESTNYVVKSIGEISNVSEELVDTMQKVAAMSEQTADFASRGQTDLAQMEDAMRHMENASKSISGKLEAINEKAANITSVVTTITKVADQTNLLSLNAAIEAEKAGEYGRGFTVVAREIRRLADQTAVATLDIEQMVQEMQSAVSAGVMEMDAFITEVQQSAENVGKISIQLTRIIEQVQALTPSFEGVNESMQFQAGSAHQINTSMVNLSEEMQQTVESLRESFMAIEQLNDAAKGLQDEVSRFKVMY